MSYTEVKNCADLSNAIALRPLSVLVDGSQWSSYTNGVFNKCGVTGPNLGVVLVGINSVSYKIKNSWGNTWGEHGYIRLSNSGPNVNCNGICNFGSYPIPYAGE